MTQQTYSHDVVFAALCIMEELLDPMASNMPQPWVRFWSDNGVNEIRSLALELAPHADAAWAAAYARFEQQESGEAEDPGSFDYDFIPVWLRNCVNWDADRPRVRNPQILADKLAAESEAVRSSDNSSAGVLACPQCKSTGHLYDRADVRYDPDSRDWVVGDREGTIECTECDWSGQEGDLGHVAA